MRYFATASGPKAREAISADLLGQIVTPAAGNALLPDVRWCADNAVFANKYPGDQKYLAWLARRAWGAATCEFAVAPDVVGEAVATLERSAPMMPRLRNAGFRVALAMQDGVEHLSIPWEEFDVAFLGGSTEWKIGPAAAYVANQARLRGKWVHMGRVNSLRRLIIAHNMGCDSVDGTYLAHGADKNLPKLLGWLEYVNSLSRPDPVPDTIVHPTPERIAPMPNARERSQADQIEAHKQRAQALAQAAYGPIANSQCDDETPTAPLTAALQAIVKGWRDEATGLEGVKQRGAAGRQKDLRTAATLLAAVAIDVGKLDVLTEVGGVDPWESDAERDARLAAGGEGYQMKPNDQEVAELVAATTGATEAANEIGAGITGYTPTAVRGGIQFAVDQKLIEAFSDPDARVLDPINTNPGTLHLALDPNYQVGDRVTVGGIEFTKHSDNPFESPKGTPVPEFVFLDPRSEPERLTFAQVAALWDQMEPPPNTSYSQIKASEECGMRRLLGRAGRHGLIAPAVPSWALIGGKAFHAAIETIERYHPADLEEPGTVSTLWVNALDGQIADAMHESGLQPDDFRASARGLENGDWWRVKGEEMVHLYLDKHTPQLREQAQILTLSQPGVTLGQPGAPYDVRIPAIELPFQLDVTGPASGARLNGQIDQIWSMKDWPIVIRDLKAGKTDGDTFQLAIYEYHVIRNWGVPQESVRSAFWNARKGIHTGDISAAALHPWEEIEYRVGQQMAKDAARIAQPHVSPFCHGCEFKRQCPAGPKS